jgi:2-oxoglutarate dehydrogenase E2 component (dihydrolipoamide succinyltransferase)
MSIDIVVPSLGESITEGTVAAWLKQPGDAVGVDEPVVELETDKATVEIGAPKAGVLAEVIAAEGDDVEVGAVLGRIDAEGAVSSAAPSHSPQLPEAAIDSPHQEPPQAAPPAVPADFEPGGIARSGDDGSVTLSDLLDATGSGGVDLDRLGPAVRKRIAESGVDPARIPASGRDGRISMEDVQRFLASPAATQTPEVAIEAAPGAASTDSREERVRMSRMRRTISTRLKEAQQTAAILTTFNEADMGAVKELRVRYRDDFEKRHGVRLGFTSFFAKACVAALKEVRVVNAQIDENEIVYMNRYDLGMAVSTPNGLVVPVIRDCDTKSFADIERELGELAAKARDGELKPEEMEGGTFSITNGGVFGSLQSTPILNPPQSAILGLHKIQERPMALDGEVVIRPMMYLALSYDHRLIDGRDAVTFLVRVKEAIEDPERLLLDL